MAASGGNDGGSYAATLRELAAAFTELKRDRGAPSYDRILVRGKKVCGERHAMSKASVSEVFAGRRGPASLDRLLWLVRVLLSYDDGEEVKPPERRDPELQVWRDRWHTLERARAAARRAPSTDDAERVLASDRDSVAATSLVEGIEPDDTFLRSGRHQRRSTFELLNDLPASAALPAGDDSAAAARRGGAAATRYLAHHTVVPAPCGRATADDGRAATEARAGVLGAGSPRGRGLPDRGDADAGAG